MPEPDDRCLYCGGLAEDESYWLRVNLYEANIKTPTWVDIRRCGTCRRRHFRFAWAMAFVIAVTAVGVGFAAGEVAGRAVDGLETRSDREALRSAAYWVAFIAGLVVTGCILSSLTAPYYLIRYGRRHPQVRRLLREGRSLHQPDVD